MRALKPLLLALVLLLGLSTGARAALLLGQNVSVEYFHPDLTSIELDAGGGLDLSNILVSSEVEIADLIQGVASLDIRDQQLYVSFLYPGTFHATAFNGFRLSVLSPGVAAFTSVTTDAISSLAGFGNERIGFGTDYLQINWQGLTFNAGDVLALNINAAPQAVPAPQTLALLGIALFGLAALRRRA